MRRFLIFGMILIFLVVFLAGCPGNQPWKRDTLNMYAGAVDITIGGYQTLDNLCTQGFMKPKDCNKGMQIYGYVKATLKVAKKALKAAAEAEKRYLELVSNPAASEEIKATAKLAWEDAMIVASQNTQEFSKLANEFINYLVDIGVIGRDEL